MLLLAQLVAPPLQPGPVRLPATTAPQERRTQPDDQPVLQPNLTPTPKESDQLPKSEGVPALIPSWRPTVIGDSPYSSDEIETDLKRCGKTTPAETLKACAAALTARFIKDGYVNTRVYTLPEPTPGALEVVMGVIAELQVESSNEELKAKVEAQLAPLLGSVLHIPTLEKALVEVRCGGVGEIAGNMGRLGSDPTKAVVTLAVEPSPPTPLRGDFSVGNNGSPGNGEWRSNAVLLQGDFIKRGDTALLFLELKNDGQLELGSTLLSATYTYPLSDTWNLTGSVGYSHSNFVEFKGDQHKLNFRTLQGLVQVDTVFHQGESLSWTGAAGISASRTASFQGNSSMPDLVVGVMLAKLLGCSHNYAGTCCAPYRITTRHATAERVQRAGWNKDGSVHTIAGTSFPATGISSTEEHTSSGKMVWIFVKEAMGGHGTAQTPGVHSASSKTASF